MAEPAHLPLRILVKGASTVVYTSWMSGPRSDFAWPRVIEAELYAAGFPAEVRCTAIPAEPTRFAIREWQREVLTWSPDVIILNYGHLECVHLFLPRWLERHANSITGRPGRVRMAYRTRLLRPVWRLLANLQAALDKLLPPNLLSYKPRRVAADLQRYIERVRTVASPMVLIPDIPQPGKPYQKWFPGMGPRVLVMNDALRDLVARIDQPDIRMFPLNDMIGPLVADGEDACPDGGHLTVALHRAVGEGMADVVLQWASQQPHLDLGGYRARAGDPDRGPVREPDRERLSPAAD
jgi:hypothetical protein